MITIRKYKNKDAKEVADLISDVFNKYNSNEGSKESVRNYAKFYKSKEIKKIFAKSPIFYVAVNGKKIVGMIRGNDHRIFNLFVSGICHGKGVGSRLLKSFEKKSKERGTKVIKIRSSLFAEKFYEKMGYKKTTGKRNFKELLVQPMKKIF